MAIAGSRLALMAILVIVGLYFLIFHMKPLPFNHEEVGLGNLHIAHDILGTVLIIGAIIVWRKSRTVTTSTTKS